LLVASKEIGLEVNVEQAMSQNQHSAQNHKFRIGNKLFERVEQFRYLETTLTNQNSIHEEIKSRLKSGNAC
jgi:hypothetical protein